MTAKKLIELLSSANPDAVVKVYVHAYPVGKMKEVTKVEPAYDHLDSMDTVELLPTEES